jgi:hypothetical protein
MKFKINQKPDTFVNNLNYRFYEIIRKIIIRK